MVEHVLGKDEVTSSILVNGSRKSRSLVSHAHTSFTQRVTSLWLAILVNGSRKTYLSLDKDRRVDGFGIFPYTEAVIFLNDYGKDQGQHGEDEVLGM